MGDSRRKPILGLRSPCTRAPTGRAEGLTTGGAGARLAAGGVHFSYPCKVPLEKILESDKLAQQANNNSAAQFAGSPDLDSVLSDALIDALDAHTLMSTQAINSPDVRRGIKDLLLNHFGLWERLRKAAG